MGASGINNPTVPGGAFVPPIAKGGTGRSTRGKVVKVPKADLTPKIKVAPLKHPRMKVAKDSTRLKMPKMKKIV